MKLEQSLYEARPFEELRVYQVGDLESLSASVLYYGTKGSPLGNLGSFGMVETPLMKADKVRMVEQLKVGVSLPGDLTIKKIGKNSLVLNTDYGLLRDIYTFHPDGHGSRKEIALGKNKLLDKKSW